MRNPVAAGKFYSVEPEDLAKEVDAFISPVEEQISAIGAVVPHAGYMFSGEVAGEVYSSIQFRETYIILGPNHTGGGERFSALYQNWKIPTGIVNVDRDLLSAIMERTSLLKIDEKAHIFEHSIEVQLPFIKSISPNAFIVPIVIKNGTMEEYQEVAKAITGAIQDKNRDAMIIASSDMSHYETRQSAGKKDRIAIKEIEKLDPEGLLNVVEQNSISMCGCVPAAVMLMCSKIMGAKQSKVIRYTDSGEVTDDDTSVVGYAGIVVY